MSAVPDTTIERVLQHYDPVWRTGPEGRTVQAAGFSGAVVWRIAGAAGASCLRRWPAVHPSADQLAWIHQVLEWVGGQCRFLAVPRRTKDGRSFVRVDGHLWELSPWLPGQANFRQHPSVEKLHNAMRCLAQFHESSRHFPNTVSPPSAIQNVAPPPAAAPQQHQQPSPAFEQRLERLDHCQHGFIDELTVAVQRRSFPRFAALSHSILDLARPLIPMVRRELQLWCGRRWTLQPCLRDIWHEHVLFEGSQVTGLIDYGAMRFESPAADVARLLGSTLGSDRPGWQDAVEAYREVRPFRDDEFALAWILDRATMVLSGLNWIEWIYIEQRHFSNPDRVHARLVEIESRLR